MPRVQRSKKTPEHLDDHGKDYYLVQFPEDNMLKICEQKDLKKDDKGRLMAFWSPTFYPAIVLQKSTDRAFLTKALEEHKKLTQEIETPSAPKQPKTNPPSKKAQLEEDLENQLNDYSDSTSSTGAGKKSESESHRSSDNADKRKTKESGGAARELESEGHGGSANADNRKRKMSDGAARELESEGHGGSANADSRKRKMSDGDSGADEVFIEESDDDVEEEQEDFSCLGRFFDKEELQDLPFIEKMMYKSKFLNFQKMKTLRFIKDIPDFTNVEARRRIRRKQPQQDNTKPDHGSSALSYDLDLESLNEDEAMEDKENWKERCQRAERELKELKKKVHQLEASTSTENVAGPSKDSDSRPNPGFVAPAVAEKYKMIEIAPGSGVYLYPFMLERIERIKTFSKAAKNLLMMFYGGDEIIRQKKLGNLDQRVVGAIISYVHAAFGGKCDKATRSQIRQQLHNKVNGIMNYHRNAEKIKAKKQERRRSKDKRV